MKQSTKEAYAEVNTILNFMDEKYIKEIPEKVRTLFKNRKSETYNVNISADKPLKEQNLKKETLSILAVLNYNYWCKDEDKRKALIQKYTENEKKYQEELKEKYNTANLFKNQTVNAVPIQEKSVTNATAMVAYKNTVFNKIKNWFQSIFSKKK